MRSDRPLTEEYRLRSTDIASRSAHAVIVIALSLLFARSGDSSEIERHYPALAKIFTEQDGTSRTGTGFAVAVRNDDAFVVTAAHVVEGAGRVRVAFYADPRVGCRESVAAPLLADKKDLRVDRLSEEAADELDASLAALTKLPVDAASRTLLAAGPYAEARLYPEALAAYAEAAECGGEPAAVTVADILLEIGLVAAAEERYRAVLWTTVDPAVEAAAGSQPRSSTADRSAAVAEALRRAQLETKAEERWSSPYFWAAFAVSGRSR